MQGQGVAKVGKKPKGEGISHKALEGNQTPPQQDDLSGAHVFLSGIGRSRTDDGATQIPQFSRGRDPLQASGRDAHRGRGWQHVWHVDPGPDVEGKGVEHALHIGVFEGACRRSAEGHIQV